MADHLANIWNAFFAARTKPLQLRFSGLYRAVVVETNDPLRMRRVRFKIPELHDWNLKPEECPWAVPSFDLGMRRSGRFSYPCVGDHIWITFEKGHPYAPVYTGFSTPTRRKFYPLPSIHGKTQIPVNEKSEIQGAPQDYDEAYLPKDERPMNHGWQDRYGNLDEHNSVGFFPIEHTVPLPPPDADPLTKSNFKQSNKQPEVNNPDSKMMVRMSKYGMLFLQADMGYKWKKKGGNIDTEKGDIEEDRAGKSNPGDIPKDEGEFTGDFDEDEDFEIKRWLYMQKVLHEDKPKEHDMRRMLLLSRYGSKFEMRDVGWNKSREGEWWPDKRKIGFGDDERWMKLRTKGGHIIEISDIGFDPEEDEFIKRSLLDEAREVYLDKEDKFKKTKHPWNQYGDRDMRMLRFVTRSGIKFALDDRESHDGGKYLPPYSSSAASRLNEEIGIGALVKGRATPGTKADNYAKLSGNPRGYYWQFDERPGRNSTTWGTPMGQAMEMDDNEELTAIFSRIPDLPTKWKYLEDNEFLEKSVESLEPQKKSHHLLIDHGRELIRFKTRAGHGEASKNKKLGTGASGEFAGIEIHDAPEADPWAELVDHDQRGIWFSRKDSIGIWRAKKGKDMHIWLDDTNDNIVIRNRGSGKVQIVCSGNIELISDKVVGINANVIEMKATTEIKLEAGGTPYTMDATSLKTTGNINARQVYAFFPTAEKPAHINGKGIGEVSGGGSPVSKLNMEPLPARVQPDNRHQ